MHPKEAMVIRTFFEDKKNYIVGMQKYVIDYILLIFPDIFLRQKLFSGRSLPFAAIQ
jgi:hypothetical protein